MALRLEVQQHSETDMSSIRRVGREPSPAAVSAALSVLESLTPGARDVMRRYFNGEAPDAIRARHGMSEEEFRRLMKTTRETFQRLWRTAAV